MDMFTSITREKALELVISLSGSRRRADPRGDYAAAAHAASASDAALNATLCTGA